MRTIILSMLLLFASNAMAATDDRTADREILSTILADMVTALNAHDFERAAKHLDAQGVITYYNAEVTVGHADGKKYFDRMLKQSKSIIKEYRLTGEASAPAIFHGDTAVAYGTTDEYFKLTEGLEFNLTGHWSVILQKSADDWKILNLHFSTNLFDNPLLTIANKLQWVYAIVALIAGMLLMLLLMKLFRKNKS